MKSREEVLFSLEEILHSAGANRHELEKVLHRYLENPTDSLKYKAACFLIKDNVMERKILKSTCFVTLALITGYSLYMSQNSETSLLSLVMDNVEALADATEDTSLCSPCYKGYDSSLPEAIIVSRRDAVKRLINAIN